MSEHVLDQLNQGTGGLPPSQIYALWGDSNTGVGVIGSSNSNDGVYGQSNLAQSGNVDTGFTPGGIGVQGVNTQIGGFGVSGTAGNGTGVLGSSMSGTGVSGVSSTGPGVSGESDSGAGVFGSSVSQFGVFGKSGNAGVAALNTTLNNNNQAYLASGCCAAYFVGDVATFGNLSVIGNLSKSSGGFQIDHPLDPDNRYLVHSFVESSEMKNIYDGMAVLDPNGEAVVELPEWFEPLNTDFHYQLTPIGAPGPNLYIAEEISNHRFKIAGGSASMKVSWQVTGIRQDAWAKAHPIQVEEGKPAEERGYYLHPELHGVPKEKSIERVRHPQ